MTETTTTPAIDLTTFEGIRAARKNPSVTPTLEQIQKVLNEHRQLVADLAVASAVAAGERHAEDRLDMPKEKVEGKPSASDLRQSFDKAHRHLSRLVYWYGKLQVNKFHELHLSPKFAVSGLPTPQPDDDYEPSEDEDLEDAEV